ncbi:DUF1702 family protein [Changchengzhania lutea]|uniref:DUF1702 family protein n=1 Tax=Changchengzhania lutea TaxID=2049305 RepID=UPI00115F1F91|nr:DUF1702 family protein [Changchengzhania lutea]
MLLISFLLSKLLNVSTKNVEIDVRGFDCPDTFRKNHLEKIGRTFLTGYHHIFKDPHLKNSNFKKKDQMYSGFFYEGLSMSLTLVGTFTFNKRKLIDMLMKKHSEHIYMIHVGIGWAFARLPFTKIEHQIKMYDPLLRGLIMDGYGFHQAYFKTNDYVYHLKIPTELKSSNSRHNFYQGVGRALWFIYGGQPSKIAAKIASFNSQYLPDLWSGIGLAAGYAGGVSKKELIELRTHGKSYKADMAQGVAFACKARSLADNVVEHTELASEIFCELQVKEATAITDFEYHKLVNSFHEDNAYSKWRHNIILNFQKQFSNEIILTKTAY